MRMKELSTLIEANNLAFRHQMKIPLDVLVESESDGFYIGYDQFYNKVVIESDEELSGNWIALDQYEVHNEYNMAKF